jgi:hypothetical protein
MKPRYKERIRLKIPVIFTMGSQVGEGRVLDITIPGCLIESPVTVQKAQSLQLKMCLPGLRTPFTVTLGVIRWTNGKQFGVEFIKMDESQRLLLNSFMAQHLSDLAPTKTKRNAFSEPGGSNWHLETYSISNGR